MKIKMKKKIIICVIASMFTLLGSAPWEGAAATAPSGELPATGFFIATNSFPRNTVVDITNIETNKSTRVIVARNLDSPGLLAIVSREAAELIGMRSGSVSRIRMVQPSDPIAYLRFTEGHAAGIPAYDSGNVLTEENYRDEIYAADTYTPPAENGAATVQATRVTGPSYVLEPEWRTSDSIIDLPGFAPSVEPVHEPAQIVHVVPEPVFIPEPHYPAGILRDEVAKDPSEKFDEYPREEVNKDGNEYISMFDSDETHKSIDEYITELPREEVEKDISERYEEAAREEIAKQIEEQPVQLTQFNIVPTDERPPENSIYGINPADIIPEITRASEPVVVQPQPVFIPAPVPQSSFSVPRISHLDRGFYYVQVAAVDNADSVENIIRQIDRSYSPVIYTNGDNTFRILLGPLNQGESAALLQRFKSIGFNDAFVRHVR